MEGPELWKTYPEIWQTKAKFFAWLRGSLRRALWEKYPPKISFKKSKMTKPPSGYTGKARSGAPCALTGEWTGNSNLQVDHIDGHVSLRDWDDLPNFILHLVGSEERFADFQLVGKEPHKIKSYAERMGISFEEAILEKQVIAFKKLKVNEQLEVLGQYPDATEDDLSSAKKRESFYRSKLQEANNADRSTKGNSNSRK